MTNVSPELELSQQLIRLRSTPGSGEQRRVAEAVADRLDAAGFDVRLQPYDEHHCNVVARWGSPDAAAICLSGHLDTVSVVEDEWQHDPYGAEVVGSRLYGRGAVDMKTGVAAIVRAAELYATSASRGSTPVSLVLTAEEEVGSLGASAIAREPGLMPESKLLLIAEPTSNFPVLGHRGAAWFDVVAHGRSCHGSTPHLGRNAIEMLMDALTSLRDWCDANPTTHPVLGDRTLNIGKLRGGVLRNIVPDRAVAELDFRTPSKEEQATLAETLRELLEHQATVEPVLNLPPVHTAPDEPAVSFVRGIAARHVDLSGAPTVARFFTDASVLTPALGDVPTVICGPGSPDQAHVVDEWCEVDEIVTATAMYLDILRSAKDVAWM